MLGLFHYIYFMNIEEIYTYFKQCSSVCTDTRNIEFNALFFALKGDNFNGNTFAQQALEKGAKYSIVDEQEYVSDRCFLVENALRTLQELATYHRDQLLIPVIALTGSNGKTTTKELINVVLSKKFNTLATQGNLNNHIGVPLTLLRMTEKTDIAIIEMGANHPKEIELLCTIAQPDYGLITNFGKAHLEGFGSVEGIIKSKSELYDYIKAHQKTIFVNENDEIQVKQTLKYDNVYNFGLMTSVDAAVEIVSSQPHVVLKYNDVTIKSQLTGIYNFNNIAAAIGVGSFFKVESNDIVSAIESYHPTNHRSQIIEKGNNTIIMDAYNANPTSMMAALENFKQLEKGNKVMVLGDMFELGDSAEIEHQEIVNYLESNAIGKAFLIGKNFYNTRTNGADITTFETFEELKLQLEDHPLENKLLLIKGSRGMALERILDLI